MKILTAAGMRAAEERAIAGGLSVETLMDRAGRAAAEAIWRHFGRQPILVLCGPGNNGGDGYVIASALRERGAEVRVACEGPPPSGAARKAFDAWGGPVESLEGARPGSILVDALFGTGLARPLDGRLAKRLAMLAARARFTVAIDLPSGVSTDDGAILPPVPDHDLTITFQTLKPAHRLQPAARHMGRIVIADIGIEADSDLMAIGRPILRTPGPDDHKYRRGQVAILAGRMPGAAALAASAAAKAGAGYVRIIADHPIARIPNAVVQDRKPAEQQLADPRIDILVTGPGLGRDDRAIRLLDLALASGRPLILDADALFLLAECGLDRLETAPEARILTPHEGEFERLFPSLVGSKIDKARSAAALSKSVILFKGADTVIAEPGGRAALAAPASHWLSTAGTGDVLCGIVAAMAAGPSSLFDAACASVWAHGRSAELAGPMLVADDLIRFLPAALSDCL